MRNSESEFVSSDEFQKGRAFEEQIVRTLKGQGYRVYRNHQLPDLFVVKDGKGTFIEAKAKDRMKYHPATGYDLHSHEVYKLTEDITRVPVFVAFQEDDGTTYGQFLSVLRDRVYKDFAFQSGRVITFDIDAFLDLNTGANWAFNLWR